MSGMVQAEARAIMHNVEDALEEVVLAKLSRDLRNASRGMTQNEARFLVTAYYTMQDNRIRTANQVRRMVQVQEPHGVLIWLMNNNALLERQVASALDAYSAAHPVGMWARKIPGIGPVIAAGLLAHIDIAKAPTAGHIWSFAGLDPTRVWQKGEKRPWNADLKTLCWKIGESFVKASGRDNDVYGKVYRERKALEQAKNDAGEYAEQAKHQLERFNIGQNTLARAAYVSGKLPPAHIHARAKRYAVKLFLSHLHTVWYECYHERKAPRPYVIEHMGHAHEIPPPFWPDSDVLACAEDWRAEQRAKGLMPPSQ